MRYAYCHPTVMAGEMTHNARDTEARDNEGLQATLAYCHPTVMAGEMTHNARDTEARDNEGLQATLAIP